MQSPIQERRRLSNSARRVVYLLYSVSYALLILSHYILISGFWEVEYVKPVFQTIYIVGEASNGLSICRISSSARPAGPNGSIQHLLIQRIQFKLSMKLVRAINAVFCLYLKGIVVIIAIFGL